MEGLGYQKKQLVLYLEDNGNLLKIFDLDNDMLKTGRMARKLQEVFWRKNPLDFTILPRQDANGRKRTSFRVRYD